MNTKLWHIGIASAIMGTMGLAQAQTSPAAESPNSPPSMEAPAGASGSIPGIPSSDPSNATSPSNSPNWDSSQGSQQAPAPTDYMPPSSASSVDDSSTQGTFLGVGERQKQSSNNNDGLNVPPAFGAGGSLSSKSQ